MITASCFRRVVIFKTTWGCIGSCFLSVFMGICEQLGVGAWIYKRREFCKLETPIHTIDEYRVISGDVWQVFKTYFDDDANMMDFTNDVHKLDNKYRKNVRQYCFMQKLLKVYFDELNELKQLKGINYD